VTSLWFSVTYVAQLKTLNTNKSEFLGVVDIKRGVIATKAPSHEGNHKAFLKRSARVIHSYGIICYLWESIFK
jgi:hypothetical protein